MKLHHALGFAALVGLSSAHASSILLSDDFSDPALDATKWQTILPYGQSSVTQSGGSLTTQGRGILATKDGFNQPYTINGAFTLLDGLEHFDIALRTDLSAFGTPFAERSGIIVTFVVDGQGVGIQQYLPDSTTWYQLAVTPYALQLNQSYFFSITDDGANVSLALNGVNLLSAATTFATGNQVALYSREFAQTATRIDGINVVGDSISLPRVPDSGSTSALIAAGVLGLVIVRQRN